MSCKSKYFRYAIIETKDGSHIVEAIKKYLPEEYFYSEETDSVPHHLIHTPSGDCIQFIVDEEHSNTARTSNIFIQDNKPISEQPHLEEDELSKLARSIRNDKKSSSILDIRVEASDSDLGIK